MEIVNHGTRSKEKTPLQANLAGVYSLAYRTLELKPVELASPPDPSTRQVYSIRIGTRNRNLLYVNHQDRTSVSTTFKYTPVAGDPDLSTVVFQYSIHKYCFLIEPGNMQESDEVVHVKLERL